MRPLLLSLTPLLTLGLFVLTPSSASACGLIETPPQGYGSPINFFSEARELIINAECDDNTFQPIVGLSRTDKSNFAVYTTGYRWSGTKWESYTLTPRGSDATKTGQWILGDAQGPTLQYASSNDPTYFVAYSCHWVNNAWKCGCQTSSCSQPAWQLQAVRKPYVAPPPTAGGGTDGGGSGPYHDDETGRTYVFNVDFTQMPLGPLDTERYNIGNQSRGLRDHVTDAVIIDTPDGRLLRAPWKMQPRPQGLSMGTFREPIPHRDEYWGEFMFRHAPNYDTAWNWNTTSNRGQKIGCGVKGGTTNAPKGQRTGTAFSTGNGPNSPFRSYTLHVDGPSEQVGDGYLFPQQPFTEEWRTVRWHLKLNTPGQRDGIYRVWINGEQVANRTNMQYRAAGQDWQFTRTTFIEQGNEAPNIEETYSDWRYCKIWHE